MFELWTEVRVFLQLYVVPYCMFVATVLALIYGTAKNSYISDRSMSIRMC